MYNNAEDLLPDDQEWPLFHPIFSGRLDFHPYPEAMLRYLSTSGTRSVRLGMEQGWSPSSTLERFRSLYSAASSCNRTPTGFVSKCSIIFVV